MVVAMARLENRPIGAETPAKASEPKRVPPPVLPPTQYPHILLVQPAVGLYEIPAPGMPMGVPLPR